MKIEGSVGRYKSSEVAVRQFCTNCGTPIFFKYSDVGDDTNKVRLAHMCLAPCAVWVQNEVKAGCLDARLLDWTSLWQR